ncbi:MAG TPA: M14 family zinc carboxypeptidase [Gemmatimonadaceae bacterium]|nr:M14 family zinc carboxypeptidase [Gemmatimonadaceae bacterium]
MRRPPVTAGCGAALALCALLCAVPAAAQAPATTRSANGIDSTYSRLIREYTTDRRFLPASVSTLPASASIPDPQRHFGTIVGAPGVMHYSHEIYGYFAALAAATPRVRVDTVGTTEEGRPIILVVIADEESMRHLDAYRAMADSLADPRTVPAAHLDDLLARAKPIYYLNGGLHSPEMGSPEMLMELAYRLAASDEPDIARIRRSVITIINPVSEPDGRDKQVDWYLHYTKGRTEWDDGFPRSSPYWGSYVVHDNNRDGIQISQALTRAIYDIYYAWHPVIMHDLHESVPLMYVSTGTGPYNETNDPIAVSEWQLLANNDLTALDAEGLPGVWTWAFFDGWWPGYAVWVANNHNAIGRFYETFGNAGADTYIRDLSGQRYAGDPVTSRQWYRPWPPTEKVRWSARDNINYMEAGVLASLRFAADNAQRLLRNFWQKGVNSMTRGRERTPHGYVIPALERQRDPRRAAYLVNQLRRHGIEIDRRASGDSAGDFVILLDQPYRDLAVNLLSLQHFPPTAPNPPYDDIAWTLGLLYGVDVHAVDDTAVFHWTGLVPVRDTVAATAAVRGTGTTYVLPYRAQGELLPALFWLRSAAPGARAWALERETSLAASGAAASDTVAAHTVATSTGVAHAPSARTARADTLPPGSVLFERLPASRASELARRFALPLIAVERAPDGPRHALDVPRVAVYHTWYSTQDEGWARYTLEHAGIPYTSIDKDDLRAGALRKRFDVILVPETGGTAEQMMHGVDVKWSPLPFRHTAATPALGVPDSSADITGGPGFVGMANLEQFVRSGGTLITLGAATRLVAETGIARALSPHATRSLFHPGSVVRVRARSAASPILYGYPEITTVFRGNGPLYQVVARDSALVVMQYGTKLERKRSDGEILGMPSGDAGHPTADTGQRAGANTARADSAAPRDTAAGHDTATRASGARASAADDSAYVVSGMVRAEGEIIGQGAIFDIPVGAGRVIAFTFNPLHRYLNHHEFPMVWNAMANWNDSPAQAAAPQAH